ncbi:MAG: hypothetical protein RJB18_495 [Pseudomonadota bacterium]|jgi:hypothetical protein
MVDDIERDPDYIRAKQEAEKKDPNYEFKVLLNEIEVHLRYGIPSIKFIGWLIVALLVAILFKLHS